MGDEKLLREMGKRISTKRRELGITQEQLAERMDVSIQMISNLEGGKKAIRPENLVKLCAVLSTSADYILTGKRAEFENIAFFAKFSTLSASNQELIESLVNELSRK
ncbi:MAG: helix-turn-helix transcriptional regulator [Clostridia bacterium]|nr:helix-turn-helix transcriptional regulator [Clostridia bacterium]